MRRFITILGILLTAVILISGSAVAAWVFVTVHSSDDCTDIDEIEGIHDDTYATIGENPSTLGWVLLDLGSVNAMPSSQDFVVFAQTPVAEDYNVWVGESPVIGFMNWVGLGTDDGNETFTTPSLPPTASWRYILIIGASGVGFGGDYAYGPDIDAVGWDKP
jgi:hypothetical protein